MKCVKLLSSITLLALSVGTALASGPVEVNSGNLTINLGNASNNKSTRTVVLNPGDNEDEVSYVIIDEDGVETLGTVAGIDGDIVVNSNVGRDTVKVLGLVVDGLTINTGAGKDTVYINLVETGGPLDVRTGGGRDNVMLINHVSDDSTSIRTQGGRDDVSIANSFFSEGSVAVRTGGAADKLTVSYSGFDGQIPLFNGQGNNNDTFVDDGTNDYWGGEPRIVRFENIDGPVFSPLCPTDITDVIDTVMSSFNPEVLDVNNQNTADVCEVFTAPATSIGIFNGQSFDNGRQIGVRYQLPALDGNDVPVALTLEQAGACALYIGQCSEFDSNP